MSSFWTGGGWGMYPTSAFGFLLIGAALLYFFRPEVRFKPLLVCTRVLTLAAGVLGAWLGISMALRQRDGIAHQRDVHD